MSAIITVNYGSDKYGTNGVATNDINEAAAWVAFANKTNNWAIKYWEIGNEQQGNGFYGSQWEEDLHLDKSPTAYGSNAVLFVNAMKAVDPTIKVGVGLVQPGTWPDADESPPLPFDRCVLTNCGSVIDFVILHWYPDGNGGQSAATVLSQPSVIPSYVQSVRNALTADLGATRAAQIGIAITETDANTNTGPVETLYCADEYVTWFENGIFNMDWQEMHVWTPTNSDAMFLDAGPPAGHTNQQPCAPLYGAMMAHLLANAGDQLVSVSSSAGTLRVHAALRQDGKVGVMLLNENPSASQTASVTINGGTLSTTGTWFQFGLTNFINPNPTPLYGVSTNAVSGLGNTFSVTVPAYTIVDLLIPMVSNTPPVLAPISNQTIGVGQTLAFTASATDTDQPPQTLTFSLLSGPTNATLGALSGAFSWRPWVTQADSTNLFTLSVADNGMPSMSATQSFSVTVNPLTIPTLSSFAITGGLPMLQVNGDSGPDYEVLTSTDLVNWASLFIANSPTMPLQWSDTNTATLPAQFYRVKVGPPLP